MAFTHLDGDQRPNMVDVSDKSVTQRTATATASVVLGREIGTMLAEREYNSAKGSIIQTAVIAGIQAVKHTWSAIPLCHPLPIGGCKVTIVPEGGGESLRVRCTVKTTGKTGVEMEALHGATIAALTIYDMCKAMSHDIRIEAVRLLEKRGGKSDFTAP